MQVQELKEQLTDKLIDAQVIHWSVVKIVDTSNRLSREDISHLRTLLEVFEGKLKETDAIFEEIVFKTPIKLEVVHG